MSSELTTLTARELRDKIATREVTSTEATAAVFDAITKFNPVLHAFNSTFHEQAMEQAKKIDNQIAAGKKLGPLAGVPVAIKDNICTTFGTTTCSSKMLENFRSPYDATVIEKLRAAGAVFVGKTNLDEFAMGSSTENSAFGPTHNPWNTKCVPGGSSGGSAAAMAAGLCFAALGSDTGGSIRQPASLCGIVGLKPTYGLVSRYGLVAFASSLDQIGPMTRTVGDAALVLQTIAGHDPLDSTSWPEPVEDYLSELDKPMETVRIGLPAEFGGEGTSAEVAAAIKNAVDFYAAQGAKIVPVNLPHTRYGIAAYYVIAPAEASSNLARYDGVHYGHRTANPEDLYDLYAASRAEGFGPEVQRRIMLGTYALSSGYYDAYYLRALKIRQLIKRDFDEAFKLCDFIVCPTSPTTAFEIGSKSGDPLQMYLCDVFTVTCNIAGIPGLNLPCGFSADGLPIGLQLLGPTFSEKRMLRLAHQYEKNHDWIKRRPKLA
ncbi:MAG TPA: Asp-tRNA(Asn)/Glu-tRNA(Gln) amidotransferase subunit GatA [Phycisphaerae bacterium]|nr:Asp-tRNA(Asn)/Glu-tRNA(Gln) amidotransferase subunit GatA [Phycisphaerae bacterium]